MGQPPNPPPGAMQQVNLSFQFFPAGEGVVAMHTIPVQIAVAGLLQDGGLMLQLVMGIPPLAPGMSALQQDPVARFKALGEVVAGAPTVIVPLHLDKLKPEAQRDIRALFERAAEERARAEAGLPPTPGVEVAQPPTLPQLDLGDRGWEGGVDGPANGDPEA